MKPERPSDPAKRWLDLPTGPLACTDVGEGAPIVAVHGLPGSVRDWRWLGAALEPHARFIRLELPGSGATPVATMPSPDAQERAAVVVAALDALGIERATLLAHSMGGAVALAAAVGWRQRFDRLALLSSVGRRVHRLGRRAPHRGAARLMASTPWMRAPAAALNRRVMRAIGFRGSYSDEEVLHTALCVASLSYEDNGRAASRVRAPTLVAWAEDDRAVEAAVTKDLATMLPGGPRLAFESGGHNIQKTRATEIAEALLSWASR